MVYNLTMAGGQLEVTVHLVVVKGADAGRTQSKGFSSEIQAMANCACFKMHVAITAITIAASGSGQIADHREGYAGVTSEGLSEAQGGSHQTLIAAPSLL